MTSRGLILSHTLLASFAWAILHRASAGPASASLRRSRRQPSDSPAPAAQRPSMAIDSGGGAVGGGVSVPVHSHRDGETSGNWRMFPGRETFVPGDYESISEALTHTANGDKLHIQNGSYSFHDPAMVERRLYVTGEEDTFVIGPWSLKKTSGGLFQSLSLGYKMQVLLIYQFSWLTGGSGGAKSSLLVHGELLFGMDI
eukprot:746797-Hanusia_phi.AAC.2